MDEPIIENQELIVEQPPVVEPPKAEAELKTQSIDAPDDEPVVEPTVPESVPLIEPAKPAFGLNDKLEADDVPPQLKGKSVNELIQLFKESQEQVGQQQVQTQGPTREEQMAELRNNFYQDPIGSVAKMIELTIAPIMEEMQGTKAEKAINNVSNLPDYELLRPDIEEFMSNVPPQLKANPQSWQIAYERARGKNFDKLVEARMQTKVKASVPPSMPSGTGTGMDTKSVSLTSEQKAAAKAFNLTEKEYAKWS